MRRLRKSLGTQYGTSGSTEVSNYTAIAALALPAVFVVAVVSQISFFLPIGLIYLDAFQVNDYVSSAIPFFPLIVIVNVIAAPIMSQMGFSTREPKKKFRWARWIKLGALFAIVMTCSIYFKNINFAVYLGLLLILITATGVAAEWVWHSENRPVPMMIFLTAACLLVTYPVQHSLGLSIKGRDPDIHVYMKTGPSFDAVLVSDLEKSMIVIKDRKVNIINKDEIIRRENLSCTTKGNSWETIRSIERGKIDKTDSCLVSLIKDSSQRK